MSQPATHGQHPLENQLSEVVAFLASRWHAFAAGLALLCSHETDRELANAVGSAGVIGARTRVSLPVADLQGPGRRGFLFPDISIEGSDRTFQILLEAKVDAEPHHALVGGVELSQPDAYAAAWRRVKDEAPARVRRVCTLTRGQLDLTGADPMRGASITWADVVELIDAKKRTGAVPVELALIVEDFEQTIRERILPRVVVPEEFAVLREVGPDLIRGFIETFARECRGTVTSGSVGVGEDFVRLYIQLEIATHQPIKLLVRVSPRAGRYNLPGRPATVSLQFMTDSNETLPSEFVPVAFACGMRPSHNLAGYHGLRRFVDLPDQLTAEVATEVGSVLASELAGALAT